MTISLWLLFAHFVGDFLLQSDEMAAGKSKSRRVLTLHCFLYSLCFLPWGWRFACLTFVLHWLTDVWTSRITARLWWLCLTPAGTGWRPLAPGVSQEDTAYWKDDTGTRHWFFVAIGADQVLHFAALAWTAQVLG